MLYLSAAPGGSPFVKVGEHVEEDTVICIIETMKVMNEVKAENAGVIRQVFVEKVTPVEVGQPLYEIGFD